MRRKRRRPSRRSLPSHQKYPLVLIRWLDHAGGTGEWLPAEDVRNDLNQMVSVGWQLAETSETVVLAASLGLGDPEVFTDDCVIGKRLITSRRVIVKAGGK